MSSLHIIPFFNNVKCYNLSKSGSCSPSSSPPVYYYSLHPRSSSSSAIRRAWFKGEHVLTPIPKGPPIERFYSDECIKAFNKQIRTESTASYIYLVLYEYFSSTDVDLKGLAKFFMESLKRKSERADRLMNYKTNSGEELDLSPIHLRLSEINHPDKGDALSAMELALAVEELGYEKLLMLHTLAQRCNNSNMESLIKSEVLMDQKIQIIKKISEHVNRLRVVGKDGVWRFDEMLLHECDGA